MIKEHHQRVLGRLKEQFAEDPRFPALIAGGSVAKNRARDDSDVDVMFVASDEEWKRRRANRDYFFYSEELCDYERGYVDGKILSLQFLLDAADHGSEPARSAFADSFIVYSRIPELESILQRIPVYPEHKQQENLESFYSQVWLYATFFIPEAEKWNDRYLLLQSSTNLVLFGGRLILALNKILFPNHKWMMREVEKAKLKPEGFMELAAQVMDNPCRATAEAFFTCIQGYRDWGMTMEQATSRFIEDTEWNWRDGTPPIQDR